MNHQEGYDSKGFWESREVPCALSVKPVRKCCTEHLTWATDTFIDFHMLTHFKEPERCVQQSTVESGGGVLSTLTKSCLRWLATCIRNEKTSAPQMISWSDIPHLQLFGSGDPNQTHSPQDDREPETDHD